MEPRRFLKRILRVVGVLLLALVVIAIVAGGWIGYELRASLPLLDGVAKIPGLGAPVRIERDTLGVPTITGETRRDVARATGFVHGQDRFFQMDLMRRRAAGEVSEIFGPAALPLDRAARPHLFRTKAQRVVELADPDEREVIVAYTEGVNAGLASLGARPFEYLALRGEPAPWKPEDTVLVLFSMFLELQDDTGGAESARGLAHDHLPPALFAFLTPSGTEWDAPIEGASLPEAPLPGPEVADLRTVQHGGVTAEPLPQADSATARTASGPQADRVTGGAGSDSQVSTVTPPPDAADPDRIDSEEPLVAGSNNWAVAGQRTADGGALLANDMHLGHSVPNIWYRASLIWPSTGGSGKNRRVTGVTLPGTPVMVVGSNGRVAWGFTNTEGNWSDVVIVDVDPRDPDSYLTPDGPRKFEHRAEALRVKGRPDERLDVTWTIWGPVLRKDDRGRSLAIRWTAHDEHAVNFHLLRLEGAGDLDEALDLANRCGIPAQNFVAADAKGRIGWTIGGIIPRRRGFDGRLPSSWADGTRRWDGWLDPADYPRIVDPASGRIWTANARVVGGTMLETIGGGDYDVGARAGQIRDDLLALDRATARDMLAVQLDDRALFLARWRGLLLKALSPEAVAADARRGEIKGLVENWGGHAAIDSAGYRIVRGFRLFLAQQIASALALACEGGKPCFGDAGAGLGEGPLWKLVSERPLHLLSPKFKSWDEQYLAGIDAVIASLLKAGPNLARHTWGERNIARIQHPLSRAVPVLGRWLDMPQDQLAGDNYMPHVQGPTFGPSERMVVSPGREEQGFFHMPCGQSGHPLSPFYGNGHAAWVHGNATPFLPGPTAHTLILSPGEPSTAARALVHTDSQITEAPRFRPGESKRRDRLLLDGVGLGETAHGACAGYALHSRYMDREPARFLVRPRTTNVDRLDIACLLCGT